MPEVGLRELKAHASQILRDVREHNARYVVTHRGKPVAVLSPIKPNTPYAEGWGPFFEALDQAAAIAPREGPTVQEIFDEMRREL